MLYWLDQSLILLSLVLSALLAGVLLNAYIKRYPVKLFRQWKVECEEFLAQYDEGPVENDPAASRDLSCTYCHKSLSTWHNIGLLSLLIYAHRCEHCRERLALRPLIVELTCLLLMLLLYHHVGLTWQLPIFLLFMCTLAVIAFIDLDHQLILDNVVIPFLWCGLILNCFAVFTPLPMAVFGAVAGYLAIYLPAKGYQAWRKTPGVGMGDAKLLAALGAWLGIYAIPYLIIGGFAMAVILFLFRLFVYRINAPLPFAPCLTLITYYLILAS